jgi:hypothetical protein
VLAGWVAALLPPPARDRLAREHGVDVPRCSLALGLAQLALGLLGFMSGGIAYMRGASLSLSWLLIENWEPGVSTTDMQGGGLVSWLGWFLHPLAWLTGFVALTGLVRIVAFVATREPVAEPLVWLVVRLREAFVRRRDSRRRERDLGPPRPDRFVEDPDGRLVLLSCRERPEIHGGVTVEVDGRFWLFESVEDRPDGEWTCRAYRLRRQQEGELIRRLLRIERD